MILDWENDKEFALANGIEERTSAKEYEIVFCGGKFCDEYDLVIPFTYKDMAFKNFPTLSLSLGVYENCVFDNCPNIKIIGCEMVNCTFGHSRYTLESGSKLFKHKDND